MRVALMAVGLVAEMVGWWRVSSGGGDVWRLMPWVLGAMGLVSLLVARPPLVGGPAAGTALAVGLGSGLALYVATRVFVFVAAMWPRFRREVVDKYAEAATVSRPAALALSLLVMVPAEEVFWRGLFQERLGLTLTLAGAAGLTWLAYVVANLPSLSLPIVVGAVVGGALWTGLAWWSGGVLASLASHILWTGAMLALPPGPGRAEGAT